MTTKINDKNIIEISINDTQFPATFTLPNMETFRVFSEEDIIDLNNIITKFLQLRGSI